MAVGETNNRTPTRLPLEPLRVGRQLPSTRVETEVGFQLVAIINTVVVQVGAAKCLATGELRPFVSLAPLLGRSCVRALVRKPDVEVMNVVRCTLQLDLKV